MKWRLVINSNFQLEDNWVFQLLKILKHEVCPMSLHKYEASKVTDLGTNQKHVFDFLLVPNSNLGPILHHSGDSAAFMCSWPHAYSTLILVCSNVGVLQMPIPCATRSDANVNISKKRHKKSLARSRTAPSKLYL